MSKFKKICLVFVSVVMFAMCGLLTGCGDKYKKLSWEIFYSFTEGENWQKVEGNNLELFFGNDTDIKPDENGNLNTTMYLQVKVNGVKAKNLGQIVLTNLSNGGFSGSDAIHSGTIINSGSYITIPLNISKDEHIDTKLSFRELNSGKSTTIGYSVSPTLTGMEMNLGNLIAVAKGGSATLNDLNAIKYIPAGSTMRGAKFSFDSSTNQVGYYVLNEDGTTSFKADNNTDTSAISVSEDGKTISVNDNYNLTSTNYVIRLTATSDFNPDITCPVDVYVVEEQRFEPTLNFKDGGSVSDSFTLYPASDFKAVDLVLPQAQNNSLYYQGEGVQTANPNVKAKYNLNVYLSSMNGRKYNLDAPDFEDGIKISLVDNAYHVEAKTGANLNQITFKYELSGFTNAADLYTPSVTRSIDIAYLPSAIKTDLLDENTDTPEIDTTIYNIQNQISAYFSFVQQNTIIRQLELIDSDRVFSFNGQQSTESTTISINQRVDIKFNSNVNEGSFVVRAVCVPDYFANRQVERQYISLTINVKRVVTASQVTAYAGDKTTSWGDQKLDNALNLNSGINSAYLKVYYDINASQQFDNTSVQLTSSNPNIKFLDGGYAVETINLSKLSEDSRGTEDGYNYILYKMDFDLSNADNLSTSNISVIVGNAENLDARFVVRKVLPTTGEIDITTQRANDFNNLRLSDQAFDSAPEIDGKQTVNYAVAITNNVSDFELVDSNGQNTGIKQIKIVPHAVESSQYFSNNALTEITPADEYRTGTNFSFRATGDNAQTQLLDIYVKHYVIENGIIVLKEDYIIGQFACFVPIKNIKIDPTLDLNNLRIAYVEGFENAGKLDIKFSANEANATKQIYFKTQDGRVAVDNINNLAVYYMDGERLVSSQADLIEDVLSLNIATDLNDKFSKTATITLKNSIAAERVNLTLVPTRLNNYNVTSGKNVGVKIVGFEKSANLTISADGLKNDNLYKSFINGAQNITFDVSAVVSWNNFNANNFTKGDLGYELLQYEQDSEGNIRFDVDGKPQLKQADLSTINLSDFEFEKQTSSSVLIGKATFTANYRGQTTGGGIFKLKVYTLDSFNSATEQYDVYDEFVITIGDGSLQNRFTISSAQDFAKINNALNANYSLTSDIELTNEFVPIGIKDGKVETFTGSLDGTNKITLPNGEILTAQHSITYALNLANAHSVSYNFGSQNVTKDVAGLFAIIGSNQSNLPNVSNLDVFVRMSNQLQSSNNNAAVGFIAGVNFGSIKQVNVNLLGDVNLNNADELNSHTISFGGYVGINYGRIDVKNAIVKSDREIIISSNFSTNNIGFIAGENSNGTSSILGDFSLDRLNEMQLNVNVLAKVQKSGSSQATFNVGAVVGNAQAGEIKNLLVGGKITIENSSNSYLGGIIGTSTNMQINDCATLGLTLISNSSEGVVAGIIAASTGNNSITRAKVISTVEQDTLSVLSASGEGVKVAGILVQTNASTNDTITYTSVETISNADGYHLQGKTVAGLAYGNSVSATGCFVNVDIEGETIYLITGSNVSNSEQHCYFLGKADGEIAKKQENGAIDSGKNYALVIKDDLKLYSAYTDEEYNFAVANEQEDFYEEISKTEIEHNGQGAGSDTTYFRKDDFGKFAVLSREEELSDSETYYKLPDKWAENIKSYVDSEGTLHADEFTRFDESNKYYYVNPQTLASEILSDVVENGTIKQDYISIWSIGNLNQISINGLVVDLPYLLYNSNPLAIERLQTMGISSINGQEHVEKIYSNKINDIHTTIINYHTTGNTTGDNQLDIVNSNTYNILKSDNQSGLITLTRVPTNTPISFKIIEGGDFAQIIDGTKIRFTGVSRNLPIRLRIYSQFDETMYEDAIFFTQYGVTDVNLSSTNNAVYSIDGETQKEFVANLYFSNENKNAQGQEIAIDTINTKSIYDFLSVSDNLTQIGNYLTFEFVDLNKAELINFGTSAQTLTFTATPNASKLSAVNFNRTSARYQLRILFNAQEYYRQNVGTSYFEGVRQIELYSTYITFNVIQSASSVEVGSSNSTISIGTTAKIQASLSTTWLGTAEQSTNVDYILSGNRIILNEENKDSLFIDFELVSADIEGKIGFNQIKTFANINTIPEWFKDGIFISYVKDDDRLIYSINLTVFDDFNYRRITTDVTIKITIRAKSNENLALGVVNLTIQPEQLKQNNIYMENYNITRSQPTGDFDGTIDINVSSAETTYIEPGTAGGLMVIRLEPSWACVDYSHIDLISGYIRTNQTQSGRAYITFEQMVYDRATGRYRTYVNSNNITDTVDDNGNTGIIGKHLYPISERVVDENGNVTHIYTGTIYVRMYLTLLVGINEPISVTLDLGDGVTQVKKLSTSFVPGVVPSFESEPHISVGQRDENNNLVENVTIDEETYKYQSYLIEKNSYNNIISLKMYGYQYNGRPSITFKKLNPLGNYSYNLDEEASKIGYQFITDFNNPPVQDPVDGSYTIRIRLNVGDIDYPFIMQTSLYLSVDGVSKLQNSSLIFHPTDYILTDLNVENLNSNALIGTDNIGGSSRGAITLSLNSSKEIVFKFATTSDNLEQDTLYQKLLNEIAEKYSTAQDLPAIANMFQVYLNGSWRDLLAVLADASYNNLRTFNVSTESDSGNLVLSAKTPGRVNFRFNLDYYYAENEQTGTYELHIGNLNTNAINFSRSVIFTLVVNDNATEETPDAIYNEDQFLQMNDGGNYILMADLHFDNYRPQTRNVASFDGNNHTITINSFVEDATLNNYGLFGTFDYHTDGNEQVKSTLKNVIVIYNNTELNLQNNQAVTTAEGVVFGGLVGSLGAGGIVYNCDVFNFNTDNRYVNNVTINMPEQSNARLTFGGLVGVNDGIITNSRVGYNEYLIIRENSRGIVSATSNPTNNLTFVLGNSEQIQFTGIAGGFVGVNNGRISSSFVANTNLYNYSGSSDGNLSYGSDESLTAGFVASNNGEISYSYVKSNESTLQNNSDYSRGTTIENRSNGNVAGFVHKNAGEISNSFANVEVKSDSTFIAGFVYNNTGYIHECYAASTLNGGVSTSDDPYTQNSNAAQPFVGIARNGELLSNGTMENVYYYNPNGNLQQKKEGNKPTAQGLNSESIRKSEFLHGFVFVLGNNSISERNQGVWAYYKYNSNNTRILPELNTANNVAHSYRYFVSTDENTSVLHDALGFEAGSENNPYIIRDTNDFNTIFVGSDSEPQSSFTGHVRFINDIDFNGDILKTNINYTLGSVDAVTSLEGNGMSINNVHLSTGVSGANVDEVGLFANITNSYIKNLNIRLDGSPTVGTTQYLGGLAGKIDSSVIINVNMDSSSVVLEGYNFVGGVAGIITGKSLIYGVTSNISILTRARGGQNAGMYYSQSAYSQMNKTEPYADYLSKLSYAGGIAGVIDVEKYGREKYNMSYVTVSDVNSITADYAGGIAGYFGGGLGGSKEGVTNKIQAQKLKFYTKTQNTDGVISGSVIHGYHTAGGIFAVSTANIEAAQVTSIESEFDADNDYNQFKIDQAFDEYITALDEGQEKALDMTKAGNLKLINGGLYSGGLVGIALGADISSSYAKAGFDLTDDTITNNLVLGGLVGATFAAETNYSYAIPYLNLVDTLQRNLTIGGLIGKIIDVEDVGNATTFEAELSNYIKNVFEKSADDSRKTVAQYTFSTLIKDQSKNLTNAKVNYFANGLNGLDNSKLNLFVGQNKTIEVVASETDAAIQVKDLVDLYKNDVSQVTFDLIFRPFRTTGYWSLTWERYFPLLLEKSTPDGETISNAEEFKKLVSNPNGDYRITDDITITGPLGSDPNYILDIIFTGSLTSEKSDHSTAVITITGLKPSRMYSAGFFKQTVNADFSNIIFNWAPTQVDSSDATKTASVQVQNRIGVFGGVSATDTGSSFDTIQVKSERSNQIGTILYAQNSNTIGGFGGIVGNATNTKFANCSFAGQVEANVGALDASEANIGGIAANAQTNINSISDSGDNQALSTAVAVSGCRVGNNTRFNLNCNSTTNVGLMFGYTNDADISSSNVANREEYINDQNNQIFKPEINITRSTNNIHAGGFVGYTDHQNSESNSKIDGVDILANINLTDSPSFISGQISSISIGGVAGNAKGAINNVSSDVNITLTNTTINTANLAGAVAFSRGVEIVDSAFTGEITANNQSIDNKQNSITNIVAAGVVAYTDSNSYSTLDTVFAYPIIDAGTSNTTSILMAGLVANATDTTIKYAMSAGRLMIDACSKDIGATGLKVGGAVAHSNNSLTIGDSIVITTILTDGVENKIIENMQNVHALFGDVDANSVKVQTENTTGWLAYSSDFALVNENKDQLTTDANDDGIYNLEARKITTSDWLEDRQIWSHPADGMPYLTQLASKLQLLGMLSGNAYSSNAKATQFNPRLFSELINGDDYNYYILGNNATISAGNGALNGVLLGNGLHQISTAGITSAEGQGDISYYGLIPTVNKHSAISNVHLNLTTPLNINSLLDGGVVGLLVGNNMGVVSNCSLSGVGVEINSSASLAGLVGNNNGLMAYCYSNIEIISLNAPAYAGLANLNNGKMYSNYFTGYINNDKTVDGSNPVYGIVSGYNQNSYMYNNYMAGVIVNVTSNSFGIANSAEGVEDCGSNNFVDRYANAESNIEESKNIFKYVNTSKLMCADSMGDNWHTILTANRTDTGSATYSVNTASASFGYNYGYPVVKFNKVEYIGSKESLDITKYHLYTGNGENRTSESDLTKRANSILTDQNIYKDAYKIPHYGVLMSINALANLNKNFVFIYNLDGKISDSELLNITAAGGNDNPIKQTQSEGQTDVFFTGVVVSNKNYGLSTEASEITISNFAGTGLFTNIKDSYFGNIKFSGRFNIDQGGVLGGNVQAVKDADANNVYVENLTYEKYNGQDMQINGIGDTAALFGTINAKANVKINNIVVDTDNNVVISSNKPQAAEGQKDDATTAYAGFVAGKNNGAIVFENTINLRVTFGENNYAGGLVGLNNGNITLSESQSSTKNTLTINQQTNTDIEYLGGIIGITTAGGIADGDLTISLGNDFSVAHFGGIVSQINGDITSSSQITILSTASTAVQITNNITFGGVAADLLQGNITVENLAICKGADAVQFNVTVKGDDYATQSGDNSLQSGMGGFIGRQIGSSAATIKIKETIQQEGESSDINFNISISSHYADNNHYGKDNLGGLVGYTEGGRLTTNLTSENTKIELTGSKNVGGLFGLATALPPSAITGVEDVKNEYAQHYNALKGITININGLPNIRGEAVESTQGNVGGLIGLYTGATLVATSKDEDKNEIIQTLTSAATIKYQKSGSDGEKYANNIGGVIGKVTSATAIKNLTFAGSISYFGIGDPSNVYSYTQHSTQGSDPAMFRANNVGGVIGSINFEPKDENKAQAINLVNSSSSTYGYQNVGGVVGYAENVHLFNQADSDKATINNAKAVYGVINVGGVIGVANNCTVGAEETDETDSATKTGLTTTGSVYGNYNVGGLVGFALITVKDDTTTATATTTIANNTIGADGDKGTIEVKGVAYYVQSSTIGAQGGTARTYGNYYLPSNVGGLVGFAHSSALSNNTIYAQVSSSNEGQSSGSGNGMVISTVSNLMGDVGESINSQYINPDNNEGGVFFNAEITDTDPQILSEHRVKFTQIHSGFGGLAGGANNITSQNNTLHNLQVNAQLGVNVGTIFGYLDAKAGDGQSATIGDLVNSIKIQNSEAINIDGGYFIGGVIGNVKASSWVEFSSADITSWGSITINLQTKNSGMYVGSLFGKFETSGIEGENGDTFTIASNGNVTIKINTGNSYYMGGLVGQYYVPAGTKSATFTGDVSGLSSIITPDDINSITEFGGFIGMLKVEKNTGNSNQKYKDVTVTTADGGKQPYAFTINTIENGNYFDGPSTFSAQEQGNDISLIAQATYVNQDNFTICPTTDNTWYAAYKNNPLRTQSTGWAKEYTMFKNMQRNIPASENKADWDAICPVYDAANITYVATQANSGYTLNYNTSHTKFSRGDYNDTSMYDKYGDSYIICTIYEPVEGNAMLYSKIGVAQPYYNENGDYATPKSIDGHKEWWKWLGVPFGFSAPSRLWYLDFSDRSEKTSKVLTLDEILDTSDKNNYRVVDRNETKSFQGTRESGESQSDLSARAFAYKVPQYHQFTLDEEDAKETWFQFVYLYESAELGGTDHRPESGSIFNVTGITTDNVDRAIYPKESGLKYWRILGAVIEILGTIAVGGIGGAISKAAGKIVAKTFIKRAAVALVKGIATAAFAGALKLGSMAFDQFASIQKQAAVYSSVQDQTIGFLGESYQRQVLYRNGIMDDNIDSTWTNEDGVLYAYVGTVRPSDYYKNKYFVYYVENADITENATDFKTETVGDLEVGKKVTNGTFKGAYECTYNEHKAYCYDYFAYHNNSYYIVMDALAGNLRYIPDQPYFDFNENSANQPNLDYIQNNGLIYVRGTFKDGSYTMQETNTWNNHWYGSNNEDAKRKTKDDDGNETTLSWQSGNGQFAVSQPLEYVAVHTGNIDGSYISNSNNRDNDFYKDGETIKEYSKDGDLSKVYYNGYGYMNGIYYTARVKAIQSMDANGDIKDIPAKIGKFTYNGTDEPEGTLNVDYIKVNIKTTSDGSTSYEPGYYIFDSVVDSADNINIYKLNDSLDQQAQELYVNMYPDSFVNPYKESTTNTKDTDYYYILKEAVGDFNGITYAPTYFYFDGGYETNSDGLVFTELQSTFTYSYTEDGKTKTVEVDLYDSKENLQKATDDLKLSEDDDTIDGISKIFMLTIYNGETPVTVTYKKFIDNYENIYSGDDYYILPIDLNRSDIGGMDIYKVKNNYIIDKNNHICELDSNYMVYQTTGDNDSNAYLNGMICYTKLQIPNAGGSTNSWNFNKYCVDAEKGIYARYSYANLNSGTEFRTGDNKTYLLYNNGFNRPNGGGTTYFVEGVRVILGGGGEYQNLYEGNNLDPGNDIGSITCE